MPTHGSITKAGKVRNQTPKIQKTQRKKTFPRKRNRTNYKRRVICGGVIKAPGRKKSDRSNKRKD